MQNVYRILLVILPLSVFGQTPEELEAIKTDLTYLASDELEGREPGTEGASQARDYIVKAFTDAHFDDIWTQEFDIPVTVTMTDGKNYWFRGEDESHNSLGHTFFPVKYSENGTASGKLISVGYGITAPEKELDNYEGIDANGRIVLVDIGSPDGIHPHSEYLKYHGLDYRIRNAKEHGAVGVIFIKNDETSQPPQIRFKSTIPSGLPAVYYIGDEPLAEDYNYGFSVDLQLENVSGYNVIGHLDRGFETTLIIGAHYDHLGYGGDNSLYRGEPAVHNGADDNASGTTALLHLTRNLSELAPAHNLLFIAFSGEERGLLGSDYFTKQSYYEELTPVAMLNMDMVGRLDEERSILISGTGTAEEWGAIIEETATDFKVSKSAGGTGASDHTSFYQTGVPVLHFFTGTHDDYHKPTDDADKINYEGLYDVAELLKEIANDIPASLNFQETTSDQSKSVPRFNVTLGIIPDYVFGGPGVKVDGVTDGKPASNAGIEAGDIIMVLGEYPATDIYAYMRALGAFKPGDTIQVTLKRGDEELELELTF